VIELRGGSKYTHRPPRTDEPKPPAAIPKCPRHLDKEAKKEWRRMVKELEPLGVLTRLDKAVLARYCQGSSKLAALKEELNTIKNPELESNSLTVRAEQYRIDYQRWNQARIETAKGLFKTEGGKLKKMGNDLPPKLEGVKFIKNPYLEIERQSFTQMMITENKIRMELRAIDEQMRRDEIEMGLTPSSRSRVKVAGGQPDKGSEKERFFS